MRKVFKPLIALSVLAAFGLSVVLCCCVMQLVHAPSLKSMNVMASDLCQKDPSSQKTSHHGYCFLQAPAADKVQLSIAAVPSLEKVVYPSRVIAAFEHYAHQLSFVRTAYEGVLFSRAGPVPLYLQTHSLRL